MSTAICIINCNNIQRTIIPWSLKGDQTSQYCRPSFVGQNIMSFVRKMDVFFKNNLQLH